MDLARGPWAVAVQRQSKLRPGLASLAAIKVEVLIGTQTRKLSSNRLKRAEHEKVLPKAFAERSMCMTLSYLTTVSSCLAVDGLNAVICFWDKRKRLRLGIRPVKKIFNVAGEAMRT